MAVQFDIASLHIRGFRGLASLDIEFLPRVPTYLLGANNSGKSTVLNALALAFKDGGFDTFTPRDFDFYRDPHTGPTDEFSIQVSFRASDETALPAAQGMGNPRPVHGIRVVGERREEGLVHRHHLIDGDAKKIVYSPRTPLTEKLKPVYGDQPQLGYRNIYAKLDDIKGYLPDVWYLRADNLTKSLYEWRSGPLQRLAAALTKSFIAESWTFSDNGQERPMPDTMRDLHKFFARATVNFPFWREQLRPALQDTLSRYIGNNATIDLAPGIQPFEEWLTQQIALSFAAGSSDSLTPLRSLGDGWQALVRLAALETLVHLDVQRDHPVLLLFEEPETYLHPHLKRKLRTVLEKLAAKDWIVICTTHSPEFLSFTSAQHIVRLGRTSSGVTKGEIRTDTLPEAAKLQEKLDEYQSHEFMFARRVILAEGKDDCYALNIFFAKAGIDCDALCVSSVGLRGAGNIPDYAKIAGALRIPWCAITDEDATKTNVVEARAKLTALKTPPDFVPVWPGSLEQCLGISGGKKATPEWQDSFLAPRSLEELRFSYPDFIYTAEKIAAWVRSP